MFQSILGKGRNRSKAGFTIFELIVVLAILGILAGVLYPKLQNREEAAKIMATEMDMLRIYEACEAWKANRGQKVFAGLTYDALDTAGLWDTAKTNPWNGAYSLSLTDAGGADDDTVVINSGTLPNSEITSSLESRLSNKGYAASSTETTVQFQAPYGS